VIRIIQIIILFLLINACDPCNDCNSTIFEPTVSLIFINQDSIQNIDDSLAVFAFNDSVLTANIDSLDDLRDSLEIVLDSIANGGSLTQEQLDLEGWIADRQVDSALYATLNQDADSLTAIFNQTKLTSNSGLLKLDGIEVLTTSTTLPAEDSATTWNIPLAFDGSFNQYQVTLEGTSDILTFSYDNFQEVDQERTVLIRAANIELTNFTQNFIDSVSTSCQETCFDDEASFTIYF